MFYLFKTLLLWYVLVIWEKQLDLRPQTVTLNLGVETFALRVVYHLTVFTFPLSFNLVHVLLRQDYSPALGCDLDLRFRNIKIACVIFLLF